MSIHLAAFAGPSGPADHIIQALLVVRDHGEALTTVSQRWEERGQRVPSFRLWRQWPLQPPASTKPLLQGSSSHGYRFVGFFLQLQPFSPGGWEFPTVANFLVPPHTLFVHLALPLLPNTVLSLKLPLEPSQVNCFLPGPWLIRWITQLPLALPTSHPVVFNIL